MNATARTGRPHKPGTWPERHDPPPGLQTFYVSLRRGREYVGQRTLGGLTEEQLAWVLRSAQAEADRRERERLTPTGPVIALAGTLVVMRPDRTAQFALF